MMKSFTFTVDGPWSKKIRNIYISGSKKCTASPPKSVIWNSTCFWRTAIT